MKRTIKLAALTALAGLLTAHAVAAQALSPGEGFLKLSHEQRYYWINGSVLTLAHYVAADERNKAKGECITKWFLDKKDVRLKQIEDSIAMSPQESPTTIIFALLHRACGIFPEP
jgi:hypothetical protein